MFSNLKLIGICMACVAVLCLLGWAKWLSSKNDNLIQKNLELTQANAQLAEEAEAAFRQAKANAEAAEAAIRGREQAEAALLRATEERNKIQKRWSSLYQAYTEAIQDDPETNSWDSTLIPYGAVGVLLQAGGIRAPGGNQTGVAASNANGPGPRPSN